MAKANSTRSTGKPKSDRALTMHDSISLLIGDLTYVRDFIEMANERATNHCSDGKTVALLDAAMPRLRLAVDAVVQLENVFFHEERKTS